MICTYKFIIYMVLPIYYLLHSSFEIRSPRRLLICQTTNNTEKERREKQAHATTCPPLVPLLLAWLFIFSSSPILLLSSSCFLFPFRKIFVFFKTTHILPLVLKSISATNYKIDGKEPTILTKPRCPHSTTLTNATMNQAQRNFLMDLERRFILVVWTSLYQVVIRTLQLWFLRPLFYH